MHGETVKHASTLQV